MFIHERFTSSSREGERGGFFVLFSRPKEGERQAKINKNYENQLFESEGASRLSANVVE